MRTRFVLLLIFFATFLTYAPSFGNQFVWDDEQFIYENTYVLTANIPKIFSTNTTAGSGIASNYYRPLTTLSFALDANLWGMRPLPFHLTNTFLHALAAVLVFLLLRQLRVGSWGSLTIALIFALHPIQTEAVTYMNSRGDSLYTVFSLLSLLSFWHVVQKRQYTLSLYNLRWHLSMPFFAIATVVTYALSILSKEIGLATGGLLAVLALYAFFQRTNLKQTFPQFVTTQRLAISVLAVSFLLAVSYIGLRATVLNFGNTFNLTGESSVYTESIAVRMATFSMVFWQYIRLLIVPYPLYMERTIVPLEDVVSLWPSFSLVALSITLFVSVKVYKKTRQAFIPLGAAWMLVMLAPVSGIIPINGIMYEHWLYLPLIGFFLMLYGCVQALWPSQTPLVLRRFFPGLLFVFCTTYAILTIRQNYFWSTPVRLYEYLLQYTHSLRIYNNLGMAYADAGDREKAITAYKTALTYGDSAATYHNLANTYRDLGDIETATEYYTQAIATDPRFIFSYVPLIRIQLDQENPTAAAELLTTITAHFPNEPIFELYEYELLLRTEKYTEAQVLRERLTQTYQNDQVVLQELRHIDRQLKTPQ